MKKTTIFLFALVAISTVSTVSYAQSEKTKKLTKSEVNIEKTERLQSKTVTVKPEKKTPIISPSVTQVVKQRESNQVMMIEKKEY